MKNSFGAFIVAGTLLAGSVALADVVSGLSTTNVSNDVTLTQLTLSKPSDALANDLLLANVSVDGGSPAVITAPAGWVLVARANNDINVSVVSYYKIVSASEPATYTWNITPQTHAAGGITRYSGVDMNSPIDVVATSSGRGTNAAAPSITTTSSSERVIALFATNVGNAGTLLFSTTTGMVKQYDAKNTPFGPTTAAEDMMQTTGGATGALAVTISNGPQRDWAAQTIALKRVVPLTSGLISYWKFDADNSNDSLGIYNGIDTNMTYAVHHTERLTMVHILTA